MSRLEKPHALLVDDNEATCALITALLQREFSVQLASDGVEAIEHLKTRSYSVILLDLRMPQLDGFGVLEFLREHSPEMLKRVLVVTAALSSRELQRASEYGVCGIVRKPFEVDTLLEAVKNCAGMTGGGFGNVLYAGTPFVLLLADLIRQTRW